MAAQAEDQQTTVILLDDEILLSGFSETDPEVVRYVAEADDGEEAIHRSLRTGVRMLRAAGATLDGELVERRFEQLSADLAQQIDAFGTRVDQSANGLLDQENGKLAIALRRWLEDVSVTLGETFDETSKKSAIAKLEKVLGQAREDQVGMMRRLLDPDDEQSPLKRWRSEIVATVEKQGKAIEESLVGLREQLAAEKAKAVVFEQTAIKGLSYEQAVFEAVQAVVTPLGDVPDFLGSTKGANGAKVGDVGVDVDPTRTPGRTVRYVIEVKDTKLPLAGALKELDAAMRCRDATAALMVVSGSAVSPIREPFQCFDDKAIVVFDKEQPEPAALRLALLWARWVASREHGEADGIDVERLRSLIDDARRALKATSAIRTNHTQARNAIEFAGSHLDQLEADVKSKLDELEAELARGPEL